MTDQEREDLHALVHSPGWQRLTSWAYQDMGTRLTQATESAANLTDDVAALNQLRQVIAAKRAVDVVMQWPATRLKELDAKAAGDDRPLSLARGGVR